MRIRWEEKEKDCVRERVGAREGGREREDWRWEGKKERRCTNKC